jgi:hypothetical protein
MERRHNRERQAQALRAQQRTGDEGRARNIERLTKEVSILERRQQKRWEELVHANTWDSYEKDKEALQIDTKLQETRSERTNQNKFESEDRIKALKPTLTYRDIQNIQNRIFFRAPIDSRRNDQKILVENRFEASNCYSTLEDEINKKPKSTNFNLNIPSNDVYLKPIGYNNNPWPTTTNHSQYLRTPGYVRPDDVKFVLKDFDEVLTKDASDFIDGDYIWVGFQGREWNVYRYTRLNVEVVDVLYSKADAQITLKFSKNNIITVDTIIGIDQAPEINGFYKVVKANLQTVVLSAPALASFTIPFKYKNTIFALLIIPIRRDFFV